MGGDFLISSDVIRGYNDTIILSLLIESDSYGYQISKEIQMRTQGHYIMKETTLYSTFNRLEKNGFIESYPGEETFGKKRTYFHITKKGKAYYAEKCVEWKLTKDVVNVFTRGGEL